jgi:hypothetical protein
MGFTSELILLCWGLASILLNGIALPGLQLNREAFLIACDCEVDLDQKSLDFAGTTGYRHRSAL